MVGPRRVGRWVALRFTGSERPFSTPVVGGPIAWVWGFVGFV